MREGDGWGGKEVVEAAEFIVSTFLFGCPLSRVRALVAETLQLSRRKLHLSHPRRLWFRDGIAPRKVQARFDFKVSISCTTVAAAKIGKMVKENISTVSGLHAFPVSPPQTYFYLLPRDRRLFTHLLPLSQP